MTRPSSRRTQEIGEALQDTAIHLQSAPATFSTPHSLVTSPNRVLELTGRSRSPPRLRLPYRTRDLPTHPAPTAQIEFDPPLPRIRSPTHRLSPRPLPPAAMAAFHENLGSHRYSRDQSNTVASTIDQRLGKENRNSLANHSGPRHGAGDVQSIIEALSAQREEDLIFDMRNSLLFGGSLLRGSNREEDLSTTTVPTNESIEATRIVSYPLCTVLSCPIQEHHTQGIFLVQGDVPRTRNENWG